MFGTYLIVYISAGRKFVCTFFADYLPRGGAPGSGRVL
jgi:hypothetical protein